MQIPNIRKQEVKPASKIKLVADDKIISVAKMEEPTEAQNTQQTQQVVKSGGFRPPRLDYFVTTLKDLESNDSINKNVVDLGIHPSSIINIEIKFIPDNTVNSKDTTVIVFYKTKIDNAKFRVDHFYTTVGRIEDEDYANKYMGVKNISANDIISVASARCKKEAGKIPNAIILVHHKRQSNGAELI